MADFKQAFGTEQTLSTLATALNGTLTNNSIATSEEIVNTNLYDEVILELQIAGTVTTTAWLDVRVVASIDGGTNFSNFNSPYLVLPAVDFTTDNGTPETIYHARFVPPQRYKILVQNRTGATLATSNNAASYQGVYYTGA